MKTRIRLFVSLVALAMASATGAATVRANDAALVDSASAVLREFMALPAKSIPQSLLADAKGIVIIPRVVKGGFVVGVHHGRGVIVTRDESNRWTPPMVITFTGGGVGWQAGLQSSDLVLVMRTSGSVQRVLDKKLTIGVDAAAAAGPVGRTANAATDASLTAEILSYSRSRGLFVGVSVDGSALQVDSAATQMMYRTANGSVPTLPVPADYPMPKSAEGLLALIAQYTKSGEPTPADPSRVPTSPMPPPPPGNADAIRQRLAASADQLYPLIDDSWRRYLALPREVSAPGPAPTQASITAVLKRFDSVSADPRYAALQQRPEFGATHQLLREYNDALSSRGGLNLPPPPPPQ